MVLNSSYNVAAPQQLKFLAPQFKTNYSIIISQLKVRLHLKNFCLKQQREVENIRIQRSPHSCFACKIKRRQPLIHKEKQHAFILVTNPFGIADYVTFITVYGLETRICLHWKWNFNAL
jgi:hypothetical protein